MTNDTSHWAERTAARAEEGALSAIREAINRVRSWRDHRARALPAITRVRSGPAPRRLLYVSPDESQPTGGVLMLYRHVSALRRLGVQAAVVTRARAAEPSWFAHDVPQTSFDDLDVTTSDVLVVPEWFAPSLPSLPVDLPLVIFNQGPYFTFARTPFAQSSPGAPYGNLPQLRALMTVSADAHRLMTYAFPGVPVVTARPVISEVFRPAPTPPTARYLAYVERNRRVQDRELVLHLLRNHGDLDGWDVRSMSGSQGDLAATMATSPIVLSLGEREGFGLPVAEALACGAWVVGFAAGGGSELFDPRWTTVVPENDVVSFAQAARAAMDRFVADPAPMREAGLAASAHVLDTYTDAGLESDLTALLRTLDI